MAGMGGLLLQHLMNYDGALTPRSLIVQKALLQREIYARRLDFA